MEQGIDENSLQLNLEQIKDKDLSKAGFSKEEIQKIRAERDHLNPNYFMNGDGCKEKTISGNLKESKKKLIGTTSLQPDDVVDQEAKCLQCLQNFRENRRRVPIPT